MFASNTSQVSNDAVYVEDVFSTYLYTGNGSTQTITNNIDLSTNGGLVWTKCRNDGVLTHRLNDTVRGITKRLFSNLTNAESASATSITAVSSTGYTVGSENGFNQNTNTFASWTFRKQAKFFDVVTWTGDGSAKTISHSLAATPGCIIIKATNDTSSWGVYHRSVTGYGLLNATNAWTTPSIVTATTDTTFSIIAGWNDPGITYVAYLFAHNAGGFGAAGTDNVISCGSYVGNATTPPTITLGWEPQWLLIKNTGTAGTDWIVADNMRGFNEPQWNRLYPNLSAAEDSSSYHIKPTATGFQCVLDDAPYNDPAKTFIYIAIRRGPMKTPTSGTSVFDADTYTGDNATSRLITSGFAANAALITDRTDSSYGQRFISDRLRGGGNSMATESTAAENGDTGYYNNDMINEFQSNSGILVTPKFSRYNSSGKSYVAYQFRRAPSFFDVVCYTGTGSTTTVAHNLGVAPEFIIIKRRDATSDWRCYVGSPDLSMDLDKTISSFPSSSSWPSVPTASVLNLGSNANVNASGGTYVAYLFATCAGVSKYGTYTGTGTTQQINCSFTSGARFVLIKRYDSAGDWYVWDSARGIVAGNDPYLLLNSTAAEVTSTDYVDTYSAGFEISSTAPAAINANGGTFIYLAIA